MRHKQYSRKLETLSNVKKTLIATLVLLTIITGCRLLPVVNPYYIKALTPTAPPPTSTGTPLPTLTRTATIPPTDTATATYTHTPSPTPIYCDWVEIVDEGYKEVSTDGYYIKGDSTFSYIWRLRNAGQCTWTPEFDMVTVSDGGLDIEKSFSIEQYAVPGQVITIYLEIKVPDASKEYTLKWLLRNADGAQFGIGPSADTPFELTFRVAQKPIPFEPVTSLPAAVVEECNMSKDKERRINAFLKEHAVLPHLSENSEDGIENDPGDPLPGQMMVFRVKDNSRNTFATMHRLMKSRYKTYVSIDTKFLIPDGTEVVFIEIPMEPPLKLLQKELQHLIPGYDGPSLTNEFPTILGYYVHAVPLAGPDRCRSLTGAIFRDGDTEVYTDYRFPGDP